MRKPAHVEAGICDIVFAYVATGQVEAYAESLAQGDVLMVKGPDPFDLSGSGGIVLFIIRKPCVARTGHGPIIAVVREISAPELSWDGGAMRVRMVIDKNASPEAYLGLLEGSSTIHDHELASWEVLSVVDGVGTLTVDGRPLHLVGGSVVAIPPNTKQSWTPDPDTKLIAVQMFFPAGPEERYRELAAQAAHGAPPPAPQVTPP